MTSRNESIQTLRAIAAFVVFLGHAIGMVDNPILLHLKSTPFHFFFDGQCAVLLFFTITGYYSCKKQSFCLKNYGISLLKKIKKIYPPFLLVLLLAFILCNRGFSWNEELYTAWGNSFWKNPVPLSIFLQQCTLLLPSDSKLLNPPIWYLMADMRIAFILPFIVFCVRKKTIALAVLLACILPFFNGIGFLSCLQYYLWGVIAHKLLSANDAFLVVWQKKQFRHILLFLGIFLLAIFDIIQIPECNAPRILKIPQSIGAALVVVYAATSVAIRYRWLVYFGNISFEFYLIHFVVLLFLRCFSCHFVFYILFSLLLSFLLASLLKILFHKILWYEKK